MCNLLYMVLFLSAVIMVAGLISPGLASADTAAEIDRDVDSALKKLYESAPTAKELSKVAKGILVFPGIIKGGLIVGGQYGVGALRKGGKTVGYYNTVAASYGLQAGVQKFGFALFFMTDSATEHIEKSSGWEIGVGPSIVIVDEGLARSLTTTTAKDDIYAFFFDQKGLMAGLGLQGSKITQITPDK
ncbi:MAG: twin-arginine translocation pathway signal protein [Deltaproteobacteria bacterium]|nr:twin-arginine translocation pathway signal protein [Deltaproteobacteria bacterium]